jgi:cyanate permease
MNYIQKTALFIEVATAINGLSFSAQAQFCADHSHTAATKARLAQIAQSQGIEMGDVGKAYSLSQKDEV